MPNQHTGPRPLPERFWAKVDMSGGLFACWPWLGAYNKSKRFARGRPEQRPSFKVTSDTTMYAHRVALLLHEGQPLWEMAGMEACHLCEGWNEESFRCCNPAHLYWGTRAENDRDRWTRRR